MSSIRKKIKKFTFVQEGSGGEGQEKCCSMWVITSCLVPFPSMSVIKSRVVSCLICRNELVSGRSLLCNCRYRRNWPSFISHYPLSREVTNIQVCPNVSELNIQQSQTSIKVWYDFPLCQFDFCNWDKMTRACANLCINLVLFLSTAGSITGLSLWQPVL